MLRSPKKPCWVGVIPLLVSSALLGGCPTVRGGVTSEEVEKAIREGIRFLKDRQRADGSWAEVDAQTQIGTSCLATLALLTGGERPDSPKIQRSLDYLSKFGPDQLNSTYGIALQTMAFAAADPPRFRPHIAANVDWLEHAQYKVGDRLPWPGSWTYFSQKIHPGDNSNTQYALLGLNAAQEAGVSVKPQTFALSRIYFEESQNRDGGWGYTPRHKQSTASMTCAGISSLIITGARRYQGLEYLEGTAIRDCGKGGFNVNLLRGIDWMAKSDHIDVKQNFGHGQQYKNYYLYALERAGRLTGVRFFGQHDWYRLGAEEFVRTQNKLTGFWRGTAQENDVVATSFALLFLAKGRAPVLINKLYHFPDGDWDHDPDDVRNIVNIVSHDWKNLLTWQLVDPGSATIADMLQAPIAYFNGHARPVFNAAGKKSLQDFVEQGGFIFAEACCSSREFDQGFKHLMQELFPEDELRPLGPDHPVWRAKHLLSPQGHPLWGIEHGCRTLVIYSPTDLSCYWNQSEHSPANPAVTSAVKLGQNVIDYATGREMPADKLVIDDLVNFKADAPKRGALRIAKLKHAGDWNIAPQAIPNLMEVLRRPPLKFNVVISQRNLFPRDPNLIYYPFVYIHGRAALSFKREDLDALRRHLEPGGGTLFADAACGSAAFDTSFRRFVAELMPHDPLVPIPRNDELYSKKVGFDLSHTRYTAAAGGAEDFPQLEGVKINNHWAIIYSKYDIGCALERHTGIDCKGYTHESAVKIAANIVIYSTLP
jgi:hypothetical protein